MFAITLFFSLVISGCTTSPTVSKLGPGSDAAALNATRGRSDAQLSSVQAEQYSRQRRQVGEEMQLEQMKKDQFFRNAGGVIGILQGVRSIAPY
ncbi:MAG: hypothetical protein WCQ16_03605 [Verrucomicrobiae bacterium]